MSFHCLTSLSSVSKVQSHGSMFQTLTLSEGWVLSLWMDLLLLLSTHPSWVAGLIWRSSHSEQCCCMCGVQKPVWHYTSLGVCIKSETARSYCNSKFRAQAARFCREAVPFTFAAHEQWFHFLRILNTHHFCHCFADVMGVHLHFLNDWWCSASVYVIIGNL